MIKRLASVAILSLPLSLLSSGTASAAECNVMTGTVLNCTRPSSSPPPSSSPSQPSSEPSQPAPAPAPARTISEVAGAADRILAMVNNERASAGLGALSMRGDVVGIAHPHSKAMASKRTIWHNDAYFNESTRAQLRSAARGENVAMNASLEDAHRRLMASPGHRANIMNGGFTQAGFSVVQDEAGTLYVTQNFMTPESPKATAAQPRSSKATKAEAKAAKAANKRMAKAKGSKAIKAKSSKKRITRSKATKSRSAKARAPKRARTARR